VPALALVVPHTPAVHVRVLHSVSTPGHSVASVHGGIPELAAVELDVVELLVVLELVVLLALLVLELVLALPLLLDEELPPPVPPVPPVPTRSDP
jgi:hypothetical protein